MLWRMSATIAARSPGRRRMKDVRGVGMLWRHLWVHVVWRQAIACAPHITNKHICLYVDGMGSSEQAATRRTKCSERYLAVRRMDYAHLHSAEQCKRAGRVAGSLAFSYPHCDDDCGGAPACALATSFGWSESELHEAVASLACLLPSHLLSAPEEAPRVREKLSIVALAPTDEGDS